MNKMQGWEKQRQGFTIVELLIVIVVIAILAAITIVAYNGIQNRARTGAVQTAVSQANKQILIATPQNNDMYPDTLAAAGVNNTDSTKYLYSSDNQASPRGYCITAMNGDFASYVSTTNTTPKNGICPGHWDESQGLAGAPIAGVTFDTSVSRTSPGSMRIPAGGGGTVRGGPFSGSDGQKISVGMWIRVGSSWSGATSANSKIRIGSTSGGLVSACGYEDATTTWKFYSCSFTFTSSITSVNVTLPNDATAGYIYYDDLSLILPQQ